MKIILFGAGGFLGKEVAVALKKGGHHVISLTKKNCDITNRLSVTSLRISADLVINCAAKVPSSSTDADKDFYDVNVYGTKNIVDFANLNKINKIIHCSTLSVNLRPWNNISEKLINPVSEKDAYAYSKLKGESIIKTYKKYLILRLPALYGSEMKHTVINKFNDLSIQNKPITVNKNFNANFMFVKDVAVYISKILKTNELGIVNVASKNSINLLDLANMIKRKNDSSSQIIIEENGPILTASVNISRMNKLVNNTFIETPLKDGIKNI